MSPRWRAGAVVLALALAGGALGAAVAPAYGRAASEPAAAEPALTAPPSAAPSSAAPPTTTASASASASSTAPTAAPRADRDGFAPSLAIPPSAGASGAGAAGAAASERTPVSVAVPRIGVDTPLVGLGIAADGSLQVPGRDQFDLAGWLTSSAVPGQPGPSVIAGHVDSTSGPAVFFRLHELVAGDRVVVTLDDGSTAEFVVDAVERVSKGAFPTADVYGPQPGPVLRLITCGGAFDRSTGHYEDNVIAFASLA